MLDLLYVIRGKNSSIGRKITFLILLLVSFSLAQEPKQTIAVLDLDGSLLPSKLGRLTNRLISELNRSKRFAIIERTETKRKLREKGFQKKACATSDCAVKAGNILKVGMVVVGYIGQAGETFFITLNIIDVRTGDIYRGTTMDFGGTFEEITQTGMKKAAGALLGELANVQQELAKSIEIEDAAVKPTTRAAADRESGKTGEHIEDVDAREPAQKEVAGRLFVMSDPDNAVLFVDGVKYGRTPAIAGDLMPGLHKVMLKMEGYADRIAIVEVYGNKMERLKYKMRKLKATRTKPSEKQIASRQKRIMRIISFAIGFGCGGVAAYHHMKGIEYYHNYNRCTSVESIDYYKKETRLADSKRNTAAGVAGVFLLYGIKLCF